MKRVISFLLVLSMVLASFTNASLDAEASSSGKVVYDVIWLDGDYDFVGDFYEGRAVVEKDGKGGYIDKTGKVVVPIIYGSVSLSYDGKATIVKKDGKWGILRKKLVSRKSVKALASPCNLSLDGRALTNLEVYLINGHNYFKLRDIVALASDTDSKFSVDWNGDKKLIMINTGDAYSAKGSELKGGDGRDKTGVSSDLSIEINGNDTYLDSYIINNQTYYQIRDLAAALGFDVQWNNASKTVEMAMNNKGASSNLKGDVLAIKVLFEENHLLNNILFVTTHEWNAGGQDAGENMREKKKSY